MKHPATIIIPIITAVVFLGLYWGFVGYVVADFDWMRSSMMWHADGLEVMGRLAIVAGGVIGLLLSSALAALAME